MSLLGGKRISTLPIPTYPTCIFALGMRFLLRRALGCICRMMAVRINDVQMSSQGDMIFLSVLRRDVYTVAAVVRDELLHSTVPVLVPRYLQHVLDW